MITMRIPYPDAPKDGIWGEVTSQENYCEEDYLQTSLVAEFVNTLTNISYLFYAWYGIQQCRRKANFWSASLPYFGIASVGIGSAAFHGTIKLQAQWADDLAMFFATGIILHRVMSFGRPSVWSRNFALGLSALLIAVAVFHCWAHESTTHQLTFAVMIACVAIRTRKLINWRISDTQLKQRMNSMAKMGAIMIFAAWVSWNIDNMACSHLRRIRRSLGMPWGFLLELHGWWHILTAVGVYFYFALVEQLTAEGPLEKNVEESEPYAWPVSDRFKHFKKA